MNARPMRDELLEQIWKGMKTDDKIFFVAADFGSPVLDKIRADFPDRFVNVGIAEQNMVNVTAGLALEGYKVFAYAIAPFVTMRCYEQVRTNLALLSTVRKMNVTLIGVGAGFSYVVSGPTHQSFEDITLMRMLPEATVYSPSDHLMAGALFDACAQQDGLKYVRLDVQSLVPLPEVSSVARGFDVRQEGNDVCLIATGFMVHTSLAVAAKREERAVGVIDLFNLSSFDEAALVEEIKKYRFILSLEEAFQGAGGLDALILNLIAKYNLNVRFVPIGLPRRYSFELGSRAQLHALAGIDEVTIIKKLYEIAG
ncbi:MAG: transketolase family protein [Bdellovibrionales bacterium]